MGNVYGPMWGHMFGRFIFSIVVGIFAILSLIAICCAHFRCYKPTMYAGTGFCCWKFFCPLAAVISVDRYQDSTAIAAVFSWLGCIYTLCCWRPKGEELVAEGNNYDQFPNQGTN